MKEQTSYVARTSAGTPIRMFDERSLAMVWSDTEGVRDFPGHTITREVSVTVIRTTVLRRDRSHLKAVA